MAAKDHTGARFGRLVALESRGHNKHKHPLWLCRCDCGKEVVSQFPRRLSCGCLQREKARERMQRINKTHGFSCELWYQRWSKMIYRCTNPSDKYWKDYGGRGITVCERWLYPNNFYADMGAPPIGCSLDRIDNDGPYSPENCRWTDMKTQARNKSNNRRITHDGITLSLADWGDRVGMRGNVIQKRIGRGWTVREALTLPHGARLRHAIAAA